MKRIVTNLVGNAATHGRGLVRLALSRHDRWARVEVDDAGPGVPVDARDSVFERFTRIGTGGGSPGAGLGLAMVAELSALYGGRAWVEDRPGDGARFVVELPLEDR